MDKSRHYSVILIFMILPILLGVMYACAPRPQEPPFPNEKVPAADNFTVRKSLPSDPALTLPRGDEPRSMTFFQQKQYDPDNKPDACKQYFLTFTQDKILWNWLRKNCQS